MTNRFRAVALAFVACLIIAVNAHAQVTETQVAFDSASKVRSLTPALVTRYQLAAPSWPVTGDFVEARLYALSTGGRVLAVERRSGTIERYPLDAEAASALGAAIDAALMRTGAAVTEAQPEVISEPARGAFVRNQMLLTWGLYGPLLSSLANDGKTQTALYLLATGGSYFLTTAVGKKMNVTRAQNHLATDGAFRGFGASAGLLYALAGDRPDGRTYRGIGLLGALGGATTGLLYGRRLTDSEAEAATTFSTFSALTAFGLAGTAGLLDDSTDARPIVGAAVASALAGYLVGPRYPRTARYHVTRGDVQLLTLGAILGVMTTSIPLVESDPSQEVGFGLTTAGMLGGLAIADRVLVRPYDHSTSDATQIGLGALAGGLMGSALVVLTEPNASGGMAMVTAGGIAGTVIGHRLTAPRRAGASIGTSDDDRKGGGRGASLELNPLGLMLGATHVSGYHELLRVRF